MLSYPDLTHTQRKWVDLVEIHFPEIEGTITYKQVLEVHDFFTSKRVENKAYKISKALWLITNNKTGHGIYMFPGSKIGDIPSETEDSPAEIAYKEELIKLGIKPKK